MVMFAKEFLSLLQPADTAQSYLASVIYPILDTRISVLRSSDLGDPPQYSETGLTGELWSRLISLNRKLQRYTFFFFIKRNIYKKNI